MKNRVGLLLLGVMLACVSIEARHLPVRRGGYVNEQIAGIYAHYVVALDSLSQRYAVWHYARPDSLADPYCFPLFASPTLYAVPLRNAFALSDDTTAIRLADGTTNNLSAMVSHRLSAMDDALLYVYAQRPDLVKFNETDMPTGTADDGVARPDFKPEVSLVARAGEDLPDLSDTGTGDWHIVVRRPNFWSFKTNVSLQIIQNYISSNWYKGGESNYSWLAQLNLEAVYNNKQKVVFTNTLESKLGFLSTRDDETHKFRTNSDLLRLTNKLGLRATKHWYYTFMLQSWTQFYRGYKSNDEYVYSDFMSPFESVFSIGMDYTLSVKNFNISATVSPFACDLKYVDRKYLASSFGVYANKHSRFGFGSNVTVKYNWNIVNNISWSGRIYYYTNYAKAQLEWENTFNLKINKYLTTKLFVYPRFDDSVARSSDGSYFQFYEQLSFGLDLNF